MGIAADVIQHLLWPSKRWFGIDAPFRPLQRSDIGAKLVRVAQFVRSSRRTGVGRSRRPVPDTSETIDGTDARGRARGEGNPVYRKSNAGYRARVRRRERRNGGGDGEASSVPRCEGLQRNRFALQGVWGRQQWSAGCRQWLGRECR